MIKSEIITINSIQYQKTWSTSHYVTSGDGKKYVVAIDPLNTGRVYTETKDELPNPTAFELLDIILGKETTPSFEVDLYIGVAGALYPLTRIQAHNLRDWAFPKLDSTVTTDAEASTVDFLYPIMGENGVYTGEKIPFKTRRRFMVDGELKFFISRYDTFDSEHYNPKNDANGWAELRFKDGHRYIPEAMDTSNLFMKNEKGWWIDSNGVETLYISKSDYNSWPPPQWPDGWEVVS